MTNPINLLNMDTSLVNAPKKGADIDALINAQMAAAYLALVNTLTKMRAEADKEDAAQTDKQINEAQASAEASTIAGKSNASIAPANSTAPTGSTNSMGVAISGK